MDLLEYTVDVHRVGLLTGMTFLLSVLWLCDGLGGLLGSLGGWLWCHGEIGNWSVDKCEV